MKKQTTTQTTKQTPTLTGKSKTSLRKQLGNTLVPVIIAIAIAGVATIAFLNQGADLAANNRVTLAANDITAMLYDWNLLRANNGAGAITAQGGGLATSAPDAMAAANIFDITDNFFALNTAATPGANAGTAAAAKVTTNPATSTHAADAAIAAAAPVVLYTTDSADSCNTLRAIFTGDIDGVFQSACGGADVNLSILTIVLN